MQYVEHEYDDPIPRDYGVIDLVDFICSYLVWQTEIWIEEKEVSTFDSIEKISAFGLLGLADEIAWIENSKMLKKKVAKRTSIVHRSNIM
ncbi:hypothetical protein Y032_0186g1051 [Ancylostoma ceylanicum]|nr:hypothetical protein Y032_0186g1051 [Ancylostoma ceylanicum]